MGYVQSRIQDFSGRRLNGWLARRVMSAVGDRRRRVAVARARQVRAFGDLEAAIMELLWDADGPLVVREVVSGLQPRRPLAYTTVMTVMDTLHRKGWLTRKRDGRAWRYTPAVSRQIYTAQLMNEALSTTTDRAGALASFVEQIDSDDAEALADALREALAQRRSEAADR
jgi:predicted transcriptional regulator